MDSQTVKHKNLFENLITREWAIIFIYSHFILKSFDATSKEIDFNEIMQENKME